MTEQEMEETAKNELVTKIQGIWSGEWNKKHTGKTITTQGWLGGPIHNARAKSKESTDEKFPVAEGFFGGDERFEGKAKKAPVAKRKSKSQVVASLQNQVPQSQSHMTPSGNSYITELLKINLKSFEELKSHLLILPSTSNVNVYISDIEDMGLIKVVINTPVDSLGWSGLGTSIYEFSAGFTYEFLTTLSKQDQDAFNAAKTMKHYSLTVCDIYSSTYKHSGSAIPISSLDYTFLNRLFNGFYLNGGKNGNTSKT